MNTVRDVCDQLEDCADTIGPKDAIVALNRTLKAISQEGPETPPPTKKDGELTPHFTRREVDEAQKAVQRCKSLVEDAFKQVAAGKAAGAATQLTLTFDHPPKNAKNVAMRVKTMFNSNPEVLVEFLVEEAGQTWSKPSPSTWYAEKGGDNRKIVFRIHVPARATYKKPSKMSLQYQVETRALTVQSTRINLLEYAPILVAAFGAVGHAAPLQSTGLDINVMKYLPRA